MNYLIKISHECTWQEIEARVTYDLEDMLGQALVKHSLLNENKNTSVWLAEIADYNKFKNKSISVSIKGFYLIIKTIK